MLSAIRQGFLLKRVQVRAFASNDHILVTEQEQGHILEKLSDPEEVRRLLHSRKHGSLLDETLADIIVRETLEAQADDLEKRMKEATSEPEQHVHGHEHDICCGASKGEVEGSE